jgi:hypothetical protein
LRKKGRATKTCLLCRTKETGYRRTPACRARKKKNNDKNNDKFNAITAANLKATKLAAEVGKSDLTEDQITAQIEGYTDDGISNVQAHVDVHPNHLFYINGAISYRFFLEQWMFLSARGLTDESGEDSGPPLRTADGYLVNPRLFSTNLEICKPMLPACICGEVEKKIHQHFNEDNNKLWKVPGAGSVGATARNQLTPGRTFKYKIGITSCNAKNLRGCILNNKTDRKVA